MYEDFFKLKACPFKLPPDPEFLFLSNQHKLALVHLEYGLTHQAGFIVITGEIGTGKTTLIKTLLRRIDRDTVVASIFNTTVGPDEFLNLILDDFELSWSESDTHTLKLEKLKEFLLQTYTAGRKAVLIVDEAQNLSMDTLEEIRLLSNIQTTKDYLIHIFLVGQPELKQKLTHPSLRQLAQRISVHYHIDPLPKEDTLKYIEHRISISGVDDVETCFSTGALEEIYKLTRGFPRLINLLCDACLVNAFADQVKPVTRRIVQDTIKGDGAGNFWTIASTQVNSDPVSEQPYQIEQPSPSKHAASGSDHDGMGKRITELERTVQILSRLVNEKLIDSSPEDIKKLESRKTLLYLLEREQKKVISLAMERHKLREKIKALSKDTLEKETQEKDMQEKEGYRESETAVSEVPLEPVEPVEPERHGHKRSLFARLIHPRLKNDQE